jgi:hypothetical protein
MTTWRAVYTKILADIDDANAQTFFSTSTEGLAFSWAELTLNLIIMRSQSVLTKTIGRADWALVNMHSKLGNISKIHSVRKTSGERVDPIGYNALTAVDTIFTETGTVVSYYTIGQTIFGVVKVGTDELDVTYVPYEFVTNLDTHIPLRDEFIPAVELLLFSLVLARLGHFERAGEQFKLGLAGVDNVFKRPFH